MQFARVVGAATSTLKDPGLVGIKLVVVQPTDGAGVDVGPAEVATDTLGVGVGDHVLLARGSAARQPQATRSAATDAAVVAIVEAIQINGTLTYQAER